MPPKKIPKDKLKCFTRTGSKGKYVTCVDKTKLKGAKKEPAKKEPVKRKINVVKKETPKPAPKKEPVKRKINVVKKETPKPAPKKELPDDVLGLIKDFAKPTGLVPNLIEKIMKAKGSNDRKARLLDKYNAIYNKQQPFLFPRQFTEKELRKNKGYMKTIDQEIIIEKKLDKLRNEQPKVMRRERIANNMRKGSYDEGKLIKTNDLLYPLRPEYVVESRKLEAEYEEAKRLGRELRYSASLGQDKHVLSLDLWHRDHRLKKSGRINFKQDILDVMRQKINSSVLIKILTSVAEELDKKK